MPYRPDTTSADVLVVAFGRRVFGLHAQTGERLWAYEDPSGGLPTARLAVTDGHAFVGIHRFLVCLDQATGALRWRVECPLRASTLVLDGGRIYVADSGAVCCLSADGALLWHDPMTGLGVAAVSLGLRGRIAAADVGA